MSDINQILADTSSTMSKAINHLESELSKIRAGKASPSMLDGIMVDYYGNPTALNQVANVTVLDARTISIQPWEKAMLQPIEKGIMAANIGITPQNDGINIRSKYELPDCADRLRRNYGDDARSEVILDADELVGGEEARRRLLGAL